MYFCLHDRNVCLVQAVELPEAEFPGLPTSSTSPTGDAQAPKWPVQTVREKNRQGTSSGWDSAPDTPSHIAAVHSNSSVGHGDSYQGGQTDGWVESGAYGGWESSAGHKQGESGGPEEELYINDAGSGAEQSSTGNGWGGLLTDQVSCLMLHTC